MKSGQKTFLPISSSVHAIKLVIFYEILFSVVVAVVFVLFFCFILERTVNKF